MLLGDWSGTEIEVAQSAGGVYAVADAWRNVVRTDVVPWPTPELIQKLYQSRQARAFRGDDFAIATKVNGFYSDLQSLHSEDAITWSVFGPIAYAPRQVRAAFAREFLAAIDIDCGPVEDATVWLWRRLPHPDTLVPGGPEIDFGLQTKTLFLLGEAKWRSGVDRSQGVLRNKTQLQLRHEFCQKYGRRLLPNCRRFIVLGVSQTGNMLDRTDSEVDGIALHARDTTWDVLVKLEAHPLKTELISYLSWKRTHSKPMP